MPDQGKCLIGIRLKEKEKPHAVAYGTIVLMTKKVRLPLMR